MKKSQYTYILLQCDDAMANLIKTKMCRVGVPRNVITQEKYEVNWLIALSFAVCKSIPI